MCANSFNKAFNLFCNVQTCAGTKGLVQWLCEKNGVWSEKIPHFEDCVSDVVMSISNLLQRVVQSELVFPIYTYVIFWEGNVVYLFLNVFVF